MIVALAIMLRLLLQLWTRQRELWNSTRILVVLLLNLLGRMRLRVKLKSNLLMLVVLLRRNDRVNPGGLVRCRPSLRGPGIGSPKWEAVVWMLFHKPGTEIVQSLDRHVSQIAALPNNIEEFVR